MFNHFKINIKYGVSHQLFSAQKQKSEIRKNPAFLTEFRQILEIESDAHTNLSLTIGARRDEKTISESLNRRRRSV